VRDVPTWEARGLEGRWRAELGDLVGASLAFARLRDVAEAQSPADPAIVPMLAEAAAFEKSRGNLPAAQAHLAAALRIAPRDGHVSREYRSLGSLLASREGHRAQSVKGPSPAEPSSLDIDSLTEKYRADPSDDRVANALADALGKEGRAHELVALLLGRVQDFPQHTKEIKARLARLASEAKNDSDAALYREASANL
jgi:hypothetical protein